MTLETPSCRSCGERDGDVRHLKRLHGPGATHVCIDCVLAVAKSRASRRQAMDKISQIRKALDQGHDVWFCDHELFVVQRDATARWLESRLT